MRHLIAETGVGQVGIATDYLFPWNRVPVNHILSIPGLSDDDRILGGTAAKLLGIENRAKLRKAARYLREKSERLPGRPRQTAAAHPFQEGPVRQPRRPMRQDPAGAARRRKLTKREAIITQMVDKSASADLRATKMLIDMMKDAEHKAGVAALPPEPRRLDEADNEVVQLFVARLRSQIPQEIAEAKTAELSEQPL